MPDEIRERTALERVHEEVFDTDKGLKKRVGALEERTDWLETLTDVWKVLKWPLVVAATAGISQLVAWLVTLLKGTP